MNSGKLLLGVLAGVTAGALLGVLFAPEKGSDTRKRISQKGDDYASGLKDKFNNFIDQVKKDVQTGKEEASVIMENGSV